MTHQSPVTDLDRYRYHATTVMLPTLLPGRSSLMIKGRPGSGKSTLALQLIEHAGALLVADDQTLLLDRPGSGLIPACPPGLHGLLEVRGVGIVPYPAVENAEPLGLIVGLTDNDMSDRLPVHRFERIGAHLVPRLDLPHDTSALPTRLCAAMRLIADGGWAKDQRQEQPTSAPVTAQDWPA